MYVIQTCFQRQSECLINYEYELLYDLIVK